MLKKEKILNGTITEVKKRLIKNIVLMIFGLFLILYSLMNMYPDKFMPKKQVHLEITRNPFKLNKFRNEVRLWEFSLFAVARSRRTA